MATQASQKFVEKEFRDIIPNAILNEFGIVEPKVVKGQVLTGDQVVSQESQKIALREKLPHALR